MWRHQEIQSHFTAAVKQYNRFCQAVLFWFGSFQGGLLQNLNETFGYVVLWQSFVIHKCVMMFRNEIKMVISLYLGCLW
jgi:hypothetical protein